MSIIENYIKKPIESLKSKLSVFRELLRFLWERKLWWLIPMIFVLLLIGVILVFSQGSAIAPFIYTLF